MSTALGIGREWAEREWDSRPAERRLEPWTPTEADALLLLLDLPAADRSVLAPTVATAAGARWRELLGSELAGPEQGTEGDE